MIQGRILDSLYYLYILIVQLWEKYVGPCRRTHISHSRIERIFVFFPKYNWKWHEARLKSFIIKMYKTFHLRKDSRSNHIYQIPNINMYEVLSKWIEFSSFRTFNSSSSSSSSRCVLHSIVLLFILDISFFVILSNQLSFVIHSHLSHSMAQWCNEAKALDVHFNNSF